VTSPPSLLCHHPCRCLNSHCQPSLQHSVSRGSEREGQPRRKGQ
jgi:hypothetical protein